MVYATGVAFSSQGLDLDGPESIKIAASGLYWITTALFFFVVGATIAIKFFYEKTKERVEDVAREGFIFKLERLTIPAVVGIAMALGGWVAPGLMMTLGTLIYYSYLVDVRNLYLTDME